MDSGGGAPDPGQKKHKSTTRRTRLAEFQVVAIKVLLDLTEWTPAEKEILKHDRVMQHYMRHQRAELDALEKDFPGLKQGMQRLFRGISDERDDANRGPSTKGHSR